VNVEDLDMLDRIINTGKWLERSLDASWMKNEAISNNIANVNTPGYKRSDIKFEEYFQNSIDQTKIGSLKKDSRYLPIGKDKAHLANPQIISNNTSSRKDGNNVNIDVEMAELAKNTIKYNAMITQLSKEFSKIKIAIREGR